MTHIKIKVCGMREPENISALLKLKPDFIGFIFFKKSARFVSESCLSPDLRAVLKAVKKTGVFVDAKKEYIYDKIKNYQLDFVQLHGNETPEFCKAIRTQIGVIKAFGVDEHFDFTQLNAYYGACDYFLFDTKTAQKGGSGQKFPWATLANYKLDIPFFLSGGINGQDAQSIKEIEHPSLFAVDINSRFELFPGLKDIDKLAYFFKSFKSGV